MTPEQKWASALADVIGGRQPSEVAPIVGVGEETVRRWLRGDTVPPGWRWLALVMEAGKGERWPELSAARDAVASKPGPKGPRLSDEEAAERAGRRALGRRKRAGVTNAAE